MNRLRAKNAIGNVTGLEAGSVFLETYRTSYAGRSTTATLMGKFCEAHDLGQSDEIQEFYDKNTGALVILPKTEG